MYKEYLKQIMSLTDELNSNEGFKFELNENTTYIGKIEFVADIYYLVTGDDIICCELIIDYDSKKLEDLIEKIIRANISTDNSFISHEITNINTL